MFVVHRSSRRPLMLVRDPGAGAGKDQLAAHRPLRARGGAGGGTGRTGTYGGDRFLTRTLRWERQGNRIFLRTPSFSIIADTDAPSTRPCRARTIRRSSRCSTSRRSVRTVPR
jgi:hypothetical protein